MRRIVNQPDVEMTSLPEVNRSVPLARSKHWLRRFGAYAGPGYLVSVGYMDPGNWATDLEGGSRYGYALLWVVMASNLMAIFLQILCARLGLVTGKDLAQACRQNYKKPFALALWLTCEVAIIACDLAEVIGSAIALHLLFHIPLVWGVIITGTDVLLLLGLMRYGFRKIEAVIFTLVATVAGCYLLEILLAKPDFAGIMGGFVPSLLDKDALLISLGILGATVMPHNLYLHSAIVQTRKREESPEGIREAIKYNTWDTVIALGAAFFVNAAILILAAAAFHKSGAVVTDLEQAHEMLRPLLGGASATAFAVALLASGQSSTITGTLAGQIVMEGFLAIRIKPWIRRLVTRGLAIIPAIIMITSFREQGTTALLVLSQVVLSMQLSFAVFPLLYFTSSKKLMGEFVNPLSVKILGLLICSVIAFLNLKLLYDKLGAMKLGSGIAVVVLFWLWGTFVWRDKRAVAS